MVWWLKILSQVAVFAQFWSIYHWTSSEANLFTTDGLKTTKLNISICVKTGIKTWSQRFPLSLWNKWSDGFFLFKFIEVNWISTGIKSIYQ